MDSKPTARPRAYSYVRFSTPDQQRGDSFRRQMALAREYAERNGLEFDETFDLQDLGLSAYRGANAESGRLGDFLELVKGEFIPRGSYLLVESLDRLSRQRARKALRTLEDIIDGGVNVVTLFDGRVYDADSLDGTDLLIALLFMIRANEESATKARRLRYAWEQKRVRAAGSAEPKRYTSKAPAWLKPEGDGFFVIEEYADVVRAIFTMALAGKGRQGIAAALNEHKIPTFVWEQGRRRKEGPAGWYASYIGKILSSSTVIGVLTPHSEQHIDGKLTRIALDPIQNYYPRIVELETWSAVQALRTTRKPRGAASRMPTKNPLGGLLRCYCGRSVIRANKGKNAIGEPWVYYTCAGTKESGELRCRFRPIRSEQVDSAVLTQLPGVLRACPADGDRAKQLRWDVGGVSAVIAQTDRAIAALLSEAERATVSPALRARVDGLESRRAELRAKAQAIYDELEQIAPGISMRRSISLAEEIERGFSDVEAINTVCRSVFVHGEFDPVENCIRLLWRQGGVGNIALPARAKKTAQRSTATRDEDGRFVSNAIDRASPPAAVESE